eukprot:862414-Rhodomonas_salina.1
MSSPLALAALRALSGMRCSDTARVGPAGLRESSSCHSFTSLERHKVPIHAHTHARAEAVRCPVSGSLTQPLCCFQLRDPSGLRALSSPPTVSPPRGAQDFDP